MIERMNYSRPCDLLFSRRYAYWHSRGCKVVQPYGRDTPVSAYLDRPVLLDLSRLSRDSKVTRVRLEHASTLPLAPTDTREGVARTGSVSWIELARLLAKTHRSYSTKATRLRRVDVSLRPGQPSHCALAHHHQGWNSGIAAPVRPANPPKDLSLFSSSPFFSSPCSRIFKCHPVTAGERSRDRWLHVWWKLIAFPAGKLEYSTLLTTLFAERTVSLSCLQNSLFFSSSLFRFVSRENK